MHVPAWQLEPAPVIAVQSAATQHWASMQVSEPPTLQHRSPAPHDELIGCPWHTLPPDTHDPFEHTSPLSQSASPWQPTHWLSTHCLPPQSALVWHIAATHEPSTHSVPAP